MVFLIFSFVLFPTMNLMYRDVNAPTVVDLQLAFTPDRFRETLRQWSEAYGNAIETFKLELIVLDYVFPLVYATMLGFGFAWARDSRSPTRWETVFFAMPFAAGLFDWLENSLHLRLLANMHRAADVEVAEFAPALVLGASAFAVAKIVLLVLSALGVLWCLTARCRRAIE